MNRFFREPLTRFLLLGVVLFGCFGWKDRGRSPAEAKDEITVGAPQIATLVAGFQRTWQRPPNAEELSGLIKDHITEEVLYREAQTLGLDRDDILIRRRLRQKMEFLTADVAALNPPDDAALAKYFEANAAQYAEPPRLSFTHVYFNGEKRGTKLYDDVKAGLTALTQKPESAADMGDPSLLPASFETTSARDISSQFGNEFADALLKLPRNEWRGPVASSFGQHLVRNHAARGTAGAGTGRSARRRAARSAKSAAR
jgi:hypothetical protein